MLQYEIFNNNIGRKKFKHSVLKIIGKNYIMKIYIYICLISNKLNKNKDLLNNKLNKNKDLSYFT
jgi:hypothetical protein